MPKEKQNISTLLSKIGCANKTISSLSERLELIKKMVNQQCKQTEVEEECPDVAESERAVVEAIEKLFVEDLLTREPEGDA